MTKLPTAKLTTDKITTLLTALVVWALLRYVGLEVDATGELLIAGLIGWAVGGVAAYFKAETRPAESSFDHLPAEVLSPPSSDFRSATRPERLWSKQQ